MSGRDLVSEMREGGTVRAVPRAPGNPVDLLLAVVAIAAISAAGFFGVSFWLAPQPPIPLKPAPMVHSVASVQPVWTEAD
ncbi:MAG: hypothetical protein ABIO40_08145, partial [Devosia sp.]